MYVLIVCGYVGECMSVSDYVYMQQGFGTHKGAETYGYIADS